MMNKIMIKIISLAIKLIMVIICIIKFFKKIAPETDIMLNKNFNKVIVQLTINKKFLKNFLNLNRYANHLMKICIILH